MITNKITDINYNVSIPEHKKQDIIKILKSGHNIRQQWTNKQRENDITLWLNKYTKNKYFWLFNNGNIIIRFMLLEDATSFKLRWL